MVLSPTLYCYNCKLLRGSNLVLGMYPVQCLAAPCTYQGPNLPFQWFSHSSWRWCSSHDNKLLRIFLISLALLILWLQVPSFFPEDRLASISPFPNSLAIEITFFKTQFKSIFLFPKRKDLWWECGTPPPLLGLIWPEFEMGGKFILVWFLFTLPFLLEILSQPSFFKNMCS